MTDERDLLAAYFRLVQRELEVMHEVSVNMATVKDLEAQRDAIDFRNPELVSVSLPHFVDQHLDRDNRRAPLQAQIDTHIKRFYTLLQQVALMRTIRQRLEATAPHLHAKMQHIEQRYGWLAEGQVCQ